MQAPVLSTTGRLSVSVLKANGVLHFSLLAFVRCLIIFCEGRYRCNRICDESLMDLLVVTCDGLYVRRIGDVGVELE